HLSQSQSLVSCDNPCRPRARPQQWPNRLCSRRVARTDLINPHPFFRRVPFALSITPADGFRVFSISRRDRSFDARSNPWSQQLFYPLPPPRLLTCSPATSPRATV